MDLSFETLGLSTPLMSAVEKLGYQQPTPIQQQAVPVLLEGRNVLGQAQTGTGKTAAFMLPLLNNLQPGSGHIQALVLAPTRELAIQVAEAAKSMSCNMPVRVLPVYGGQSYEIQIRQLKRGVDIVVGTPGRLLDLMRKNVLDLSHVHYMVIDEADEMLEMGFIEDVETILAEVPAERQIALFSATLPAPIRRLADRFMSDPHEITINPTRRTVEETDQSLIRVLEDQKLPALIRLLEAEVVKSALIFAKTKARAQELADELVRWGYPAEALHGDLSQSRREWVLGRFRQGSVTLLVATDVAARGLDIENVSHVFNYDAPADPEDYVHRIGRTGRAGRKGIAITFFTPRERFRARQIEEYTLSQIAERRIPTLDEIANRRDDRLIQRLYENMMEDVSSRELELVLRLAQSGLDMAEVAAAALKMARAGENKLPEQEITEVPAHKVRSNRRSEDRREPKPGKVYERGNGRREPGSAEHDYRRRETNHRNNGSGERSKDSNPAVDRPAQGEFKETRIEWNHDKPRSYDESTRPARKKGRGEPGMIRLWMNMGEMQGLRPRDVVGAIAGEVGIPGRAIGEIDIRQDHSYVDVSEKHVRQVLRQSSGNYFLRGKPVMLKLAD